MASNLCRLLSSPIARSEFFIPAASRRLVSTTTQLLHNQQPETKDSPIDEDKEKIRSQIVEDEKKHESEDDESDDDSVNKLTGEIGGPRGREPTRYGDGSRKAAALISEVFSIYYSFFSPFLLCVRNLTKNK
ncbi:hypothetical protein MIMGU_mgv1a016190mg [Erythranthe guttata]|uniref:Succinate dehydrogenase assembly factor 4, mitochondrial n=1 Tax=Erythranthe guttata TaxID=4155 RepID=A0A022PTE8_ERYGU|nr:hypothetical protein MIMGU_mgv1a016190mg [Erythranthe guttata]